MQKCFIHVMKIQFFKNPQLSISLSITENLRTTEDDFNRDTFQLVKSVTYNYWMNYENRDNRNVNTTKLWPNNIRGW